MNKGENIERETPGISPASPENKTERVESAQAVESAETKDDASGGAKNTETTDERAKVVARTTSKRQPPPTKDQILQVVERVLEEGLFDTFLSMPAEIRKKFRETGEALAERLRTMAGTEVRPSSIHHEVMAWLEQIPDASEFWLEQAGYIKTTKVVKELRDND